MIDKEFDYEQYSESIKNKSFDELFEDYANIANVAPPTLEKTLLMALLSNLRDQIAKQAKSGGFNGQS